MGNELFFLFDRVVVIVVEGEGVVVVVIMAGGGNFFLGWCVCHGLAYLFLMPRYFILLLPTLSNFTSPISSVKGRLGSGLFILQTKTWFVCCRQTLSFTIALQLGPKHPIQIKPF